MSASVRPCRRQPTRLRRPWNSPGKNTGVGCHFLLQCRKVKSESEVAQSCPILLDPMDCSPPGSSIPGLGRSPGEGNGNPLQYSCLENPMGRGASILWHSAFIIVLVSIVLVLSLMNMLIWHKKLYRCNWFSDCEMGSITWILQVSPMSLSRSLQEGGWKLRSRYWVDVMREVGVRVMWGAGHEQRNVGGL